MLAQIIQTIIQFLMSLLGRQKPITSIGSEFQKVVAGAATDALKDVVDIRHPAVYETQRDNTINPSGTCAVTCLSMLLQSLNLPENGGKVPKIQRHLEEFILHDIRKNAERYSAIAVKNGWNLHNEGELRMDFRFLAHYANLVFGVEAKFSSVAPSTVVNKLQAGSLPVMIHTGKALTTSGHIILPYGVWKGKTGTYFWVKDPWGEHPYTLGRSGDGVRYDVKMFPAKVYMIEVVRYPT